MYYTFFAVIAENLIQHKTSNKQVFWRMKTQDKVISFLFLDLNSFLKRLQWEFTAT